MRATLALASVIALGACSGGTAQPGDVMSACLNVCACYSQAQEINDCRDQCNRMATGARLRVSRAFSAGSASFRTGIFWNSSGSGSFGQGQYTASADCLGCIATSSCETLTNGTACTSACATLVPRGSGSF